MAAPGFPEAMLFGGSRSSGEDVFFLERAAWMKPTTSIIMLNLSKSVPYKVSAYVTTWYRKQYRYTELSVIRRGLTNISTVELTTKYLVIISAFLQQYRHPALSILSRAFVPWLFLLFVTQTVDSFLLQKWCVWCFDKREPSVRRTGTAVASWRIATRLSVGMVLFTCFSATASSALVASRLVRGLFARGSRCRCGWSSTRPLIRVCCWMIW